MNATADELVLTLNVETAIFEPVATITAEELSCCPETVPSPKFSPSSSRVATDTAERSSTPKGRAWVKNRSASSAPEIPSGNPG